MTASSARALSTLTRWVRAFVPPAEGGLPPALASARVQLSGWVLGAIALVVGAATGFFLVVVAMALPNIPASVLGLMVGAVLGSGVALTLASRYPVVRKVGAFAILLSPLLLLAMPFLLIAAAIALLRKTASPPPRPPSATLDLGAVAPPPKARRKRRKRA